MVSQGYANKVGDVKQSPSNTVLCGYTWEISRESVGYNIYNIKQYIYNVYDIYIYIDPIIHGF